MAKRRYKRLKLAKVAELSSGAAGIQTHSSPRPSDSEPHSCHRPEALSQLTSVLPGSTTSPGFKALVTSRYQHVTHSCDVPRGSGTVPGTRRPWAGPLRKHEQRLSLSRAASSSLQRTLVLTLSHVLLVPPEHQSLHQTLGFHCHRRFSPCWTHSVPSDPSSSLLSCRVSNLTGSVNPGRPHQLL